MLTRALIGQLFVVGFHGKEVTPEFLRFLREFHIGGVILFRRNVESVEQLWELTGALREVHTVPPLAILIDEEGGSVSRVPHPLLRLPSMRALGALEDPALAHQVGATLGTELAALGVHVNLAPVMDVDTNPRNPVIGRRALHSVPETVALLGVALLRGLHCGGVTACPKHFPGHGDTSTDSHTALPRLPHDRARLDAVELVPFRAAIAAGARMVMTAHVMLPLLDPVHPATLSPVILPALLRDELGYGGLVITDDLEMAAISARYTMAEAVTLGTAGATDMFLVCHREDRQRAALEGALRLAEQDPAAYHRLTERANRVVAWKRTYFRPDRRAHDRAALRSAFATECRREVDLRLQSLLDAGSGA